MDAQKTRKPSSVSEPGEVFLDGHGNAEAVADREVGARDRRAEKSDLISKVAGVSPNVG